MPDWLAIICLGVVEGVTEFLPVSSTGHLLLVQNNGWVPHQSDLFNVGIQSGAVLAVILVFAKRVREFALEWRRPETFDYLLKLGGAFGVTAVGGLAIKALGWELPETPWPVLLATVIGGAAIILIEKWLAGKPLGERITWSIAVAAGIAQLVAGACPGTSRSGATILTIMALGLTRPAATEFSFLLGIPTLVSAGAYEALKVLQDGGPMETPWSLVFLGTVVSAATAFLAVKWLLKFVQSHTFDAFGWYRIALGVAILVLVK
ncbi:MAG: undecaprenyl-diphosphate phosphatase [Verrucomicrobia bacterium]|nr:undecaprenyl-diphosphate phosphatase [Verrucomicrobiota bacterium]